MLAASSSALDLGPAQRQSAIVVEQAAVEPVDPLEAEATAVAHDAEQLAAQRLELGRHAQRLFEHAGEQPVGQ